MVRLEIIGGLAMDAAELRAIQTPIKDKYKTEPDAAGGSGQELCSGDMLLEALVACAGVTLKAVATAIEIPLKSGRVFAEGDLDFRGTLGVAKDAPVGFREIRLRFDIETDAPQDKLDQLLKLTERYCVVYQTIKAGPPVAVSLDRA
jgi:uncharacterized OsmC-like protein